MLGFGWGEMRDEKEDALDDEVPAHHLEVVGEGVVLGDACVLLYAKALKVLLHRHNLGVHAHDQLQIVPARYT